MIRRIACVGGGPGGLFFALLAKRADPSLEITVYERNRAQDTFGFGVVFSDATLAAIDEADPVLRTALSEHGVHWDPIEVRLKGERVRVGGMGMAAVSRKRLLALLQERAAAVGVDLRFATEADPARLLADGVDLLVAGDGANSRVRALAEQDFGPTVQTAAAKFIWFGTTYGFDGLTFVHERGPHGVFAVHGYPIGGGVSTFIVETDEASWRAAGLDAFDPAQPPGVSDERSQQYLTELFADQIDGHPLLANNSRWGSFRTLRTRAWSSGRVALLGDAAHTAHFSVGSGTKMAMEDAIALASAVGKHPDDLPAALAGYEAARRPAVTRIQDTAGPSLSWWEQFGRYHDAFEPWQFAYHFMTRSIGDSRLARRDAGFVADSHRHWRAQHGAEPLHSPMDLAGLRVAERTVPLLATADGQVARLGSTDVPLAARRPAAGGPWGLWVDVPADEADLPAALAALADGVADGPVLVAAAGGPAASRRLLSEQARLGHRVASLQVAGDGADPDWATTELLSGRADLVGASGTVLRSWSAAP